MPTEFQRGARAMFDALMGRTANHWHDSPERNAICEKENRLIEEWAEVALEDVDPASAHEWRSINDAYQQGFEAGKRQAS